MAGRDRSADTLGADIRALRKARGMTLSELAEAMDRSVGWLSQVERNISHPAIVDLKRMAQILDVSISSLLQAGVATGEEGIVVRAHARRPIGSRTPGLTEGLLSPDLTGSFEVIHSSFAPGATLPVPLTRQTQEIGYIVRGRLSIWLDGKMFKLGPGDSFRLRGEEFSWANPHDETCDVIWVISPPIY
ncbi:helix-turn-helix domain-containing protein [Loktanella agnita]|uniref:helix-turn-helix domain-containing protein n=1 Tax=Loktanella agnita TaxID=287097 RepID=UPI003989812B